MSRKWLKAAALGLLAALLIGLCPGALAATGVQDDWAIYLYLCGTDLETKSGAASNDLMEIVHQQVPSGVTVVIETGGTKQWHNNVVNPNYLERYVLQGDKLARVWQGDLKSMGDSQTLAEFLGFCHQYFPARHEAVILWDHGGGSAGGLVMDELFGRDRLSLGELRSAFEKVYRPNAERPPLELVGFDCCLMATIDTAAAMSGIARYMVASEETEPGCGWNYYGMLRMMKDTPGMSGAMLGKAICDTYLLACRQAGVAGEATLSVVDLTKLDPLLEAYNRFGGMAVLAACENSNFFAEFGRGAKLAENYGGNTPSSGYADMVDLGDLARQSAPLMPEAAKAVVDALEACVTYKVNGSYRTQASGLSCYYAYDGSQKMYSLYANSGASENFKVFYDYMLTGKLDEQTQAYIIEDLGYAGEQVEELETLNDFEGSGWRVTVDEEGYAVLVVDPATLATLSDVSFQLAYVDEEQDLMLFLGNDSDIDQDWENGIFRDNFRGVWGSIDGCVCHMEVVYQGADYNLYNVPVLINGDPYQLKVAYEFDSEEYYILGAQKGLDSLGMGDRDLERLRVGDVITTLHYAGTVEGDDKFELVAMDDFVVTRRTRFEEMDLGDGEFLLLFTLIDGRGESTYTEEVIITVEGDDMTLEVP